MSDEILQDVFRCDRYGLIPVRGCLRRQFTRDEAVGDEPRPPHFPFCAGHCAPGLEHRVRATDAGVRLLFCLDCGEGLVGVGPADCPTCAARRLDAGQDVPRGVLQGGAKERAMESRRIWTGQVPDVPIGPPPSARPVLRSLFSRPHRPAPRADHLEVPTMPKPKPAPEKRTCSTEGCETPLRSDNRTGRCAGCQRSQPKAAKVARVAPKPRQVRISGPPPGVLPARALKARPGPAPVSCRPDLTLYPDDALIDLRGLVEAEIRDRLVARKAAVQSLQDALGARTEAA